MNTNLIIGLLLPFLGTTLGSGMVFFLKNDIRPGVQKSLLGFAAGVMIAASVWSLLIPSLNMTLESANPESLIGKASWIPAAGGFLLGIFFLLLLDTIIPHLHTNSLEPEGPAKKTATLAKSTMLILAVTLHNIPEGMAVGVVFASMLSAGGSGAAGSLSLAAAMTLSLGIAIQNFPEGAVISMPLKSTGLSRGKAFLYGTASGIVEPIAAIVTILLADIIIQFLPWLLSFAAGAMIYVVVEELIPESQEGEHSNIGTIGVAFGFVLMMILDVALS
jgi:ZIP family zinc transporter